MEKKKLTLYLTDMAFHVGEKRPAKTYEKTIKQTLPNGDKYGRLYMNRNPDGTFLIKIPESSRTGEQG